MAVVNINTIKNWFKTGMIPTQEQFWSVFDSYRHKNDAVPVSEVEGINELLATRASKQVLDNHLAQKGAPNGYAPLDEFTKLAAQYLNIVNDLVTGGATALLSAEQGKVLQTQVNAINTLLTSDNVNLDTVQELVDAIETVQLSLSTILVNDLTSGGITKALTAEMGKLLAETRSLKENFVNIADLSAISDGEYNNTSIINDSLLNNKEVYFPKGKYLVDFIDNDFGSEIHGPGVILKEVVGGKMQLNSKSDWFKNIFGLEYLASFHNKINSRVYGKFSDLKIFFSGDSTTVGDEVSNSKYKIDAVFKNLIDVHGLDKIKTFNKGHSGMATFHWADTYVAADMSELPDLYIIRWGINDPGWLKNKTTPPINSGDDYLNRRDFLDFKNDLRAGLSTIRGLKSVSELSIILMSPNATSDTPNGRDEKWYEEILPIIKEAARDYQCVFIDTYSLYRDSRNSSAWMDTPASLLGDAHIHPLDSMNTWIASCIFDVVFPVYFKSAHSTSRIRNLSLEDKHVSSSDVPHSFYRGISMHNVSSLDGFPISGMLTTLGQKDAFWRQQVEKNENSISFGYFRTSIDQYTWSDWCFFGQTKGKLAVLNSWVSYEGATDIFNSNGVVALNGNIRGGNSSIGSLIGTLPLGFRPKNPCYYSVLASTSAYGFYERVGLRILSKDNPTTPGGIEIISKSTSEIVFISLSGVVFSL